MGRPSRRVKARCQPGRNLWPGCDAKAALLEVQTSGLLFGFASACSIWPERWARNTKEAIETRPAPMAAHLRPISQAEPIPTATNKSSPMAGAHALAKLAALLSISSPPCRKPDRSPLRAYYALRAPRFKGILAFLRQFTRNSNHIALVAAGSRDYGVRVSSCSGE